MADNSAFMSYRRGPGYPWARLIWGDLVDRGVDAFLDLESMRAAGRFDERLLNQIASRPYFVAVLTEGTLDRCSDPDDWLRKEIEHAIDTGRIIVPVFIAPFEPSGFPPDLPEHLHEALSQSQGLTVYSQYLTAAVDKLVDELLTPVDLESAALSEEDARFHSRTLREIMSLPAPTVPETPTPSTPPPPATGTSGSADAAPVASPPAAAPPVEPARPQPVASTPSSIAPAEPEPAASTAAPIERAEPEPAEPEPAASTAAPIERAEPEPAVSTAPPVAEPVSTTTRIAPPIERPARPSTARPTSPEPSRPRSRRGWLVGGVVAVALVATLGIIGALSGGGDDESSRSADVEQRPPIAPDDREADDTDNTDNTDDTDPPDARGVVYDERLPVNDWLRPGDVVRSADGDHELVVTAEGRLQLITGGTVVWAPTYTPTATASAVFQADGNFVVYRSDDDGAGALWASGTTSVGDDGRLIVFDEAGRGVVAIFDRAGNERWREPADARTGNAADELRDLITTDRPTVESALEGWVIQLSVKRDGQEEVGIWDHDRILAEHLQLREEVGAVLVDGGDYNLDLAGAYVSLLVGRFESKEAAQQWCRDERPGDCGVKFLSANPDEPTQSWFDT